MKVKIISATESDWYYYMIGRMFNVSEINYLDFYSITDKTCYMDYSIWKKDCEVIK